MFCALADEAHYHLHCHFHGTSHDSTTTYQQRLDAFKSSKAKIMTHNKKTATASAGSQTLELNHFADWSRDEFDRVMLPLKWKRDHGYEVQKVCGLDNHASGLALHAANDTGKASFTAFASGRTMPAQCSRLATQPYAATPQTCMVSIAASVVDSCSRHHMPTEY